MFGEGIHRLPVPSTLPLFWSTFLRLPCFALVLAVVVTFSGKTATAVEAVQLDVPYVPTPQAVVDRMLELAQVQPTDYVIDLGSGDGRIPVTAARRYGVRALGVDLDPDRVREARENARVAGVEDKVTFRQQDLFDTALGEANVLTMYLLPLVNLKLRPRLLYELKPGSRIVSHSFRLGDWQPDHFESLEESDLFLWIVPAKVDGRWRVTAETPFVLILEQTFQQVTGSATRAGREIPLTDVTLSGVALSFTLEGRRYAGRVDGIVIEPTGAPGTEQGWRAVRQ